MFKALIDKAYHEVWLRDLDAMPRWRAYGLRFVRFLWAVVRDLADGQLTLRAMSLVYTTLLALVPLIAFSFAVLKGFGAHNQLEPFLERVLMPLGERASEITGHIIAFVDNVQVGVLGAVGLIILLYTVISLVQKIEEGFNYAWRVPSTRSFAARFSGYLSVLTFGPLLVVGGISLLGIARSQTAVQWALEYEALEPLIALASRTVPVLMIATAFTLFYILIPNTRVRVIPAAVAGLFAAFMWELVGTLFANFVVESARYTAIYATFAAPLLFVFWLYLAWMILLIGAQIAFYVQNPQYIIARRGTVMLDHALKEHLALAVMYLVARSYRKAAPRWSFDALSRQLRIDPDALVSVTNRLLERKLLLQAGDAGGYYAPGRDPDTITLYEIVDATRHAGGLDAHTEMNAANLPVVDAVQHEVDESVRAALAGRTLRDLVADAGGGKDD